MFPLTYVRGAELFDGDPERIILNRFSNSRIGKSNDDCTCLRDGICKRNVDIFSLIHWLLLNATCTTKKRTERIAINATRTRENVHIPVILFIYFPLIMSRGSGRRRERWRVGAPSPGASLTSGFHTFTQFSSCCNSRNFASEGRHLKLYQPSIPSISMIEYDG